MRFRKLRIAWSVFWGLLAMLLIVLWMRSYSHAEIFGGNQTGTFRVTAFSGCGRIRLWMGETQPTALSIWHSFPLDRVGDIDKFATGSRFEILVQGSGSRSHLNRTGVKLPYWFLTSLSAAVAAVPWLPSFKRFSLRTLLIVTTLVAVVLGMAVWSLQ